MGGVRARTRGFTFANMGASWVHVRAGALKEVAELAGEDMASLQQYSRLTSDIHIVKLT